MKDKRRALPAGNISHSASALGSHRLGLWRSRALGQSLAERARHSDKWLTGFAVILTPVYLFLRAKRLKQRPWFGDQLHHLFLFVRSASAPSRLIDPLDGLVIGIKNGRAEKLLWRLPDDGVEIVDHVRLVGEAAGICDIRPGKARLPHRQSLLDTSDACKLLRTGPEHRPKAARQVPLANIQLRGKSCDA